MIVRLIADVVRESQRAPAIAMGALLMTLTVAFFGTSFPGLEPYVFGGVILFLRGADALPFVELAPYVDLEGGGASISFSGEDAGAFLTSALLPLYGWMTAALVAVRWTFRLDGPKGGFVSRFKPSLILVGVCSVLFALSAFMRTDVASLLPVFLAFVVFALITAAWASAFSGFVDGIESWLTKTQKTDE